MDDLSSLKIKNILLNENISLKIMTGTKIKKAGLISE